jgi:hypothetical protein
MVGEAPDSIEAEKNNMLMYRIKYNRYMIHPYPEIYSPSNNQTSQTYNHLPS